MSFGIAIKWRDPYQSMHNIFTLKITKSIITFYPYRYTLNPCFFTSQDFLYYHATTPLAKTYLGIQEYRESITPTHVFAGASGLLTPDLSDSHPLDYGPYQNLSDGLFLANGTQPVLWNDKGYVAATARQEPSSGWRTIFWGFPWETLPQSARQSSMRRSLGWLGDLGNSTIEGSKSTTGSNSPLTYTITIRNWQSAPTNETWLTNTLPADLHIQPQSVTGGAHYHPASHTLTWQGLLAPSGQHTITYLAQPTANLTTTTLLNRAEFSYARHQLVYDQTAPLVINAADLSCSQLRVDAQRAGDTYEIALSLILKNDNPAAGAQVTAVIPLHDHVTPVTDTAAASAGLTQLIGDELQWQGIIAANQSITISLMLTRVVSLDMSWLPVTAVIRQANGLPLILYQQKQLPAYRVYFPFIAK